MTTSFKTTRRNRRHNRIRARLSGTAERPRLAVFRSNKFIYAQLIDDDAGTTLVAMNSRDTKKRGVAAAEAVGKGIAEKAVAKNIAKAVFDRGGFEYIGQIKVLADAARAGGLEF